MIERGNDMPACCEMLISSAHTLSSFPSEAQKGDEENYYCHVGKIGSWSIPWKWNVNYGGEKEADDVFKDDIQIQVLKVFFRAALETRNHDHIVN